MVLVFLRSFFGVCQCIFCLLDKLSEHACSNLAGARVEPCYSLRKLNQAVLLLQLLY